MKKYGFLFVVITAIGFVTFGCQHDSIVPVKNINSPMPTALWESTAESTFVKTILVTHRGWLILNGHTYSSDTARTFHELPMDQDHLADVTHMNIVETAEGAIYENGFYLPDDGSTWQDEPNNGYYLGVVSGTPNRLYGTLTNHLYRSTDNGATWRDTVVNAYASSTSMIAKPFSGNFDQLYVGSINGFAQSTNGGQSWTGPYTVGTSGAGIKTVAILPPNELLVGMFNGEAYRASNQATTFDKIFQADSANHLVYAFLKVNSYVFVATYGGGVFVTNDDGTHWATFNTGLGTRGLYVESLAYYGNYVFAGTSQGLFRTQIIAPE